MPDALPLDGSAKEVMTWVTLSCGECLREADKNSSSLSHSSVKYEENEFSMCTIVKFKSLPKCFFFVSTVTPNATIRYSLNGDDPSESTGEPYETSFAVYADECQPNGCTVRARGFKDGWQASAMREVHFTIEPVAPDPVFTPLSGTFVGFVDVLLDVGVAATASRSRVGSGSSAKDSQTTMRWTTDKDADILKQKWDGHVASPGDTIRLPEDLESEDGGGAQTVQLRCVAVRPGSVPSPVIDATYTILVRKEPSSALLALLNCDLQTKHVP